MRNELIEADLNNELSGYVVQAKENVGFFDYLFGSYLVAMLATNYSPYNNLLSTIGMVIPLLFLISLIVSRYTFQREFFVLIALYLWILLGSVLSDYRAASFGATFYIMKIQFVMVIVALRCSSLQRVRFYLAVAAIGITFLVVPSLVSARYMGLEERLAGTVGQANALASWTALSFIAWLCLLLTVRKKWRWVLFPTMMIISVWVLLLTGSRGGFVTAMLSAAAGSWYVWRQGRLSTRVFFTIAVVIIAVVILLAAARLPIMRRLAGLPIAVGIETGYTGTGQETNIARLQIAKDALRVFYDHPIFGAGYGTFRAYSQYVYTHTTPFEFLFATGIVGTFLYYFVVVSGWRVLGKAKKMSMYNPEIRRYADVGRILIITELVAGLSLPTHYSKAQAIISGAWLGIAWYMRSWINKQLEYQYSDETDFELGSHFAS